MTLALEHAHRQGVLHRDIKPLNLLLDSTGNVWVTDFGLAKTLEPDDLTSTGDVLGTVRYVAPQRFEVVPSESLGCVVSGRADPGRNRERVAGDPRSRVGARGPAGRGCGVARAQSCSEARNRAITSIGGLLLQDWSDRTQLNEETRLYRKALNDAGIHESQELVHELESDGRARGLLIQAYETLARAQGEAGDRAAAIETAQKGIKLARALLEAEHSENAGRLLGSSLLYLGSIAPDRETSLRAHRESTAVFEALLADYPRGDRKAYIQMIGLNHHDAGNRECLNGRIAEAITEFLAARETWDALIREFGPSPERSSYQAGTELYLCRAYSSSKRGADCARDRSAGHRNLPGSGS